LIRVGDHCTKKGKRGMFPPTIEEKKGGDYNELGERELESTCLKGSKAI